jgi:glutaredoxin
MAGFSMVLVGLMLFTIKAVCVFCVLSAVLSTVLFALSLLLNRQEERGSLIFRVVLTGLLVFLVGLGWASLADQPAVSGGPGMAPPVRAESSPAKVELAKHLTQSGAKIYTAYWCPHCHDQKELFGREATEKLTVIECAPDGRNSQKELCEAKKIEGYPTWEINGTLDSGVKPLLKLAELVGYKGPALN